MAKKITIECEVTISDGELTPAEREKNRKEKKDWKLVRAADVQLRF